MFCESSFQVMKNQFQLGRLRSRCGFVAKLFDPIFESLKHGPEAEKGANIVPQTRTVFDTVHTVEGLDFELLLD
jgi:hypothetical protein